MKALSLKEMALELGDIIVCESETSCMFTHGCEYEVMLSAEGKLGVITDNGFHATTSASIFTKSTITHSANKLPSGALNEWPTHEIKRTVKLPKVRGLTSHRTEPYECKVSICESKSSIVTTTLDETLRTFEDVTRR